MRSHDRLRVAALAIAVMFAAAWAGCARSDGSTAGNSTADGTSSPPVLTDRTIRPGEGVGPLRLGMRYAEVTALLGPATAAVANNRLGFARYPTLGLELVVTSPAADEVTPESIVVAIGVRAASGNEWGGDLRPGQSKADVERALGAGETIDNHVYFNRGASIELGPNGQDVVAVAVLRPWTNTPEAPPMVAASEAKSAAKRGGDR